MNTAAKKIATLEQVAERAEDATKRAETRRALYHELFELQDDLLVASRAALGDDVDNEYTQALAALLKRLAHRAGSIGLRICNTGPLAPQAGS